jgi:fructosamine-3-kinase
MAEKTSNPLFDGVYNQRIEAAVSQTLGKPYHIDGLKSTPHGMHKCAVFSGTLGVSTPYEVFVKMGREQQSADQFRVEAWQLNYLRDNSPMSTPKVLGLLLEPVPPLLILEAVPAIEPQSNQDWEQIAQALASLHRVTNDRCGLETHTYLGIFRQENSWKDSWTEFYGECRLRDTMGLAIKAGNMTTESRSAVEKLIQRLPQIAPEPENFSLLHGDPWIANLLFTGTKVVAIDCGLYYGNREIDLTTTELFKPMPPIFLEAYNHFYPLEPGFNERRDLWKINQWLGHVTLMGERYMGTLMEAVNRYL